MGSKWESTDIIYIPHFRDKGHLWFVFFLQLSAIFSMHFYLIFLPLSIYMYVYIIHVLKKYPQFGETTDSWFIISLRRFLNEYLKWATFWLYEEKKKWELHIHCLHTIKTNCSFLRLHDFQPITLLSLNSTYYVFLY